MQPAKRPPTPLPEHPLPDVARLTEVLDRHGVDYLVIGGVATQAYGAERPTGDFDCLVRRSVANFDRLAAAMRELNARLRVEGLSDDEAAALPVQLDGLTLSRSQISTWATDAGYLDVLVDMVNRQGHRQQYEDLEGAAEELTVAGVQVHVAGLEDIIASKEHAGRPKDHEALPELYRLRDGSTRDTTPRE